MQTDRPIETATQDRFDRAPFARRIAEVIRERKDASTLVMAIYGPWGDGKSSTISLIKEALAAKTPPVVIVDYNPWLFNGSTETLTRSLFLTLGDPQTLRQNITRSLEEERADGAEALLEVFAGKAWDMTSGVPHVADIRTDGYDVIKELVDPDFLFALLSERYGPALNNPEYSFDSDVPVGQRLAMQFAFLRKKANESPPA